MSIIVAQSLNVLMIDLAMVVTSYPSFLLLSPWCSAKALLLFAVIFYRFICGDSIGLVVLVCCFPRGFATLFTIYYHLIPFIS